MPCLSPGLLAYQLPLSPPTQVLSAGPAEPPCTGTGSREVTCGVGTQGAPAPVCTVYLFVYSTFCADTLCSLAGHESHSVQVHKLCWFKAVLVFNKKSEAGGKATLGWGFAPALRDAE